MSLGIILMYCLLYKCNVEDDLGAIKQFGPNSWLSYINGASLTCIIAAVLSDSAMHVHIL